MSCTSRAISLERPLAGGQEMGLQQQVLGRVAVDRQLREHHQLGAGLAGALDAVDDLGGVAVDVTDGGVDLGQRDAQRAVHVGHARFYGASGLRPAVWETEPDVGAHHRAHIDAPIEVVGTWSATRRATRSGGRESIEVQGEHFEEGDEYAQVTKPPFGKARRRTSCVDRRDEPARPPHDMHEDRRVRGLAAHRGAGRNLRRARDGHRARQQVADKIFDAITRGHVLPALGRAVTGRARPRRPAHTVHEPAYSGSLEGDLVLAAGVGPARRLVGLAAPDVATTLKRGRLRPSSISCSSPSRSSRYSISARPRPLPSAYRSHISATVTSPESRRAPISFIRS